MIIFAKSKRPRGHYRAGRFWPFSGTWAQGLSEDELAQLRADPFIIVETARPLAEMTVEEMRAYAAARGIALGDAKKRDDILALIEGATA